MLLMLDLEVVGRYEGEAFKRRQEQRGFFSRNEEVLENAVRLK